MARGRIQQDLTRLEHESRKAMDEVNRYRRELLLTRELAK